MSARGQEDWSGDRPRRAAIIGCGAIARSHAAAIDELEGLELAAVIDKDPDALARAEAEFGTRGYTDIEAMLTETAGDGGVDVACVCTPPASH